MSAAGEEWRPIPGYERYFVSNMGQVRGALGRILRPHDLRGYRRVTISRGGQARAVRVHRLVMAAFVPLDPSRPHVDHINGDKADNRLVNLRYVTVKENCANTARLGHTARGATHGSAKLSLADVQEIRRLAATGLSGRAISENFSVAVHTVERVMYRRSWKHV